MSARDETALHSDKRGKVRMEALDYSRVAPASAGRLFDRRCWLIGNDACAIVTCRSSGECRLFINSVLKKVGIIAVACWRGVLET